MNYENILFQIHDGVGVLTFNRPKALNALNPATLDEVADVIETCGSGGLNSRTGTYRSRRQSVRGRRRHKRVHQFESFERPAFCRKGPGDFLRNRAASQARYCVCERFCTRGWVRDCNGLRFHLRFRQGEIRPTGSKSWAHSRVWRNAEAIAPGGARQSKRDSA